VFVLIPLFALKGLPWVWSGCGTTKKENVVESLYFAMLYQDQQIKVFNEFSN